MKTYGERRETRILREICRRSQSPTHLAVRFDWVWTLDGDRRNRSICVQAHARVKKKFYILLYLAYQIKLLGCAIPGVFSSSETLYGVETVSA